MTEMSLTKEEAVQYAETQKWADSFCQESFHEFDLASLVTVKSGYKPLKEHNFGRVVKETPCYVWILCSANENPQQRKKVHIEAIIESTRNAADKSPDKPLFGSKAVTFGLGSPSPIRSNQVKTFSLVKSRDSPYKFGKTAMTCFSPPSLDKSVPSAANLNTVTSFSPKAASLRIGFPSTIPSSQCLKSSITKDRDTPCNSTSMMFPPKKPEPVPAFHSFKTCRNVASKLPDEPLFNSKAAPLIRFGSPSPIDASQAPAFSLEQTRAPPYKFGTSAFQESDNLALNVEKVVSKNSAKLSDHNTCVPMTTLFFNVGKDGQKKNQKANQTKQKKRKAPEPCNSRAELLRDAPTPRPKQMWAEIYRKVEKETVVDTEAYWRRQVHEANAHQASRKLPQNVRSGAAAGLSEMTSFDVSKLRNGVTPMKASAKARSSTLMDKKGRKKLKVAFIAMTILTDSSENRRNTF